MLLLGVINPDTIHIIIIWRNNKTLCYLHVTVCLCRSMFSQWLLLETTQPSLRLLESPPDPDLGGIQVGKCQGDSRSQVSRSFYHNTCIYLDIDILARGKNSMLLRYSGEPGRPGRIFCSKISHLGTILPTGQSCASSEAISCMEQNINTFFVVDCQQVTSVPSAPPRCSHGRYLIGPE